MWRWLYTVIRSNFKLQTSNLIIASDQNKKFKSKNLKCIKSYDHKFINMLNLDFWMKNTFITLATSTQIHTWGFWTLHLGQLVY